MNFPFNFIIIPAIIIVTAVVGNRYVKAGFAASSWYKSLTKPKWTPSGHLIAEIWFFLYTTTGLAVLWYWNVPVFSWFHYVAAAILIINAYLNAICKRTMFVEHNLPKAYKLIQLLFGTAVLATILIFLASPISSFLMLPYIIWLGLATFCIKKITDLNKTD